MATYVNASFTAPAGGGSGSWNISVPSGVQNGDLMLLVSVGYVGGTYTVPSGWNTIQNTAGQANATNHQFFLAWRLASSEPASYTVTNTSTSSWPLTVMYVIRGVTGTPVIQSAEARNASYVTTPLANAALSGVLATSLVIYGWGGVVSAASGNPGLTLPTPGALLAGSSQSFVDATDGSCYGIMALTGGSTAPGTAAVTVGIDQTNFAIEVALPASGSTSKPQKARRIYGNPGAIPSQHMTTELTGASYGR